MIVMKFGGTSVESAEAIERIAGIVRERIARRPVVVVSAMGKTTNKLLAIADAAVAGRRDTALYLLEELRQFHLKEAAGLDIADQIDAHFQELTELVKGITVMGEMTPRANDTVSAFGERLSSIIVTARFHSLGIPAEHLDSRTVIVTDRRHTQAAPNFAETYKRLCGTVPALAAKHVVVMGGFIASTDEGVTSTLGRGGSDYTASIVGAGIGAEEIQIWTDVDGMLTSDPTIMPGGYRVETVLFRGGGGVGVLRGKGFASGHGAAGHREEYPGADSEFAAAAGGGNADYGGGSAVGESDSLDRVQA